MPMTHCSEPGCDRPINCRGLCSSHYMEAYRSGTLELVNHRWHKGEPCSVDGCDRPGRKKGMCSSHYTAEWRRLNPDKAHKATSNSWRRRHARKRGAEGSHTEAEWVALLGSYVGLCVYCGERATSRDHVVPLAQGGSDSIDNIAPACLACNWSKNSRPLLVWFAQRETSKPAA